MQVSERPVTGQSVLLRHKRALLAMTASIALFAGLASSAEAFPFFWQGRSLHQPDFGWQGVRRAKPRQALTTPSDKSKDAAGDRDAADLASKAKGVLTIVVSLDKQQLTLFSDGVPIAHSKVSTGTPSHPTPTGVFSIIQKDRWHRSNIYDNAPMYYMQRITWSGVAMHQGIVPNHPASHGCIRLPEAFARQLWGVTKLGVRVIVTRGDLTPAAISHARLFKRLPEQQLEAKPVEPPAEPLKEARNPLDVAALAARKGEGARAAPKAGDPAFDAMAYAVRTSPETPATSSDMVKSAYDTFEAPKVRRARTAPPTGVAEIRALKPGPISVFISRKEGKLFVRKGFEPVFSVPVTFEQPERPLGLHVYTALAFNADETTLRWNVVSLPSKKPQPQSQSQKGPPAYVGPPSTAAEALNRVVIPQEALQQISEYLSPGASLIIADQGLGPETGNGTDFIVLTQ